MKVWSIVERGPSGHRRVSLEIAAKAKELGDATAIEVTGLERYSALPAVSALAAKAKAEAPDLILLAATPTGRDLGARLAARLGWAYASEATSLAVEDGAATITRTMYAGKVRATVRAALPAVVSVRPGAFTLPAGTAEPRIESVPADASAEKLAFQRFEPTAEASGHAEHAEPPDVTYDVGRKGARRLGRVDARLEIARERAHGLRERALLRTDGREHQAAFAFFTSAVKAGRNSKRSPTTP
ncbi:MAG: hypothetical protein AAB284_07015 [Chloroflexota bacterium]